MEKTNSQPNVKQQLVMDLINSDKEYQPDVAKIRSFVNDSGEFLVFQCLRRGGDTFLVKFTTEKEEFKMYDREIDLHFHLNKRKLTIPSLIPMKFSLHKSQSYRAIVYPNIDFKNFISL